MPVSPLLEEARALVGLKQSELVARFGAKAGDLKRGKYGPSDWMEAFQAPPPIAGVVYLDKGEVVLVSLDVGYGSGGTVLDAMESDSLHAAYPDATRLRSRAGKQYNLYVDPGAGIAWTEGEGQVIDMELFTPMDIGTYKQRFYFDPGTFYK